MRVYISGPMRGHRLFNFPAFDKAKKYLESKGLEVVSPADMDRARGFDPEEYLTDYCLENRVQERRVRCDFWDEFPEGEEKFKQIVKEDLDALQTCGAIYMLEGWEDSQGACAEIEVARWLNLLIIEE